MEPDPIDAISENSGFWEMRAWAHLRIGVVERRFLFSTTSFDPLIFACIVSESDGSHSS